MVSNLNLPIYSLQAATMAFLWFICACIPVGIHVEVPSVQQVVSEKGLVLAEVWVCPVAFKGCLEGERGGGRGEGEGEGKGKGKGERGGEGA